MNLRRQGIKDIFTKLGETEFIIWFSGIEYEGEYKVWYGNGQLAVHAFYKRNKLHGEYKGWYPDGQMWKHAFYKNDKQVKRIKWT